MKSKIFPVLASLVFSFSLLNSQEDHLARTYEPDTLFTQDFSIQYLSDSENAGLLKVCSDRNGYIQVLSGKGLLRPAAGQMLFPGKLVPDRQYKGTSDKPVLDMLSSDGNIFYLGDKAVTSNSFAGRIFIEHELLTPSLFTAGEGNEFLISDGRQLCLADEDAIIWRGNLGNEDVREMVFEPASGRYWILGTASLWILSGREKTVKKIPLRNSIECIAAVAGKVIAGSYEGYTVYSAFTAKPEGQAVTDIPAKGIKVIREIRGTLWFGTSAGAFAVKEDGGYSYYASRRWLPSDDVKDISEGPDGSVLILTGKGVAKICFERMTLEEKAMFFEKQVRERHIRFGFNATVAGMKDGDVTTGSLEDSDNDGLWTSMYLASQSFRYAVTGSSEALQNVSESLDAMERLFTINSLSGFPSRSFERRGYKYNDPAWRRALHSEWDWKSTTSSDEAIGHIFAYAVTAELVADPGIKNKAIVLIDTQMSHILKNNLYLVDWDGKPTRWGRWNPEYVNSFPLMVGDRKLNSSNIVAMLQTAWHFTGKEKYREAAFKLMNDHGYFTNLMRDIDSIGVAPSGSNELSLELSDGWNHSDDEMYFLGYWGLCRYPFNDTLKQHFNSSVLDHLEAERPEKEALWNILAAITGENNTGISDALWFLREYPLDLRDWKVDNSNRKDIVFTEPGFRKQYTETVLPPDELPVSRHNTNRFEYKGGDGGRSEYSAGDIWLLPYWAGRYLGVIGPGEVRK